MVTGIDIELGTTREPPFGENLQFTDGRGDGNADGLEYLAAVPETLSAHAELFPVVLDGDFLQRFREQSLPSLRLGQGERLPP